MTPTMIHLFVETILNKCSDIAVLRIFDNIKSPNALERVLYTNVPILCTNTAKLNWHLFSSDTHTYLGVSVNGLFFRHDNQLFDAEKTQLSGIYKYIICFCASSLYCTERGK